MEPIMPRCLPSRDQGSRTGPATTFKLPSNLPRFRGPGITDADDFLEALSNTLLANSVEATRWTAALLVCCTEASDAAWIKDNVLNLSWDRASATFISRYRDPLRQQKLLSQFYSLRKLPSEPMRTYAARFEQLTHSLGLKNSTTLVPQFIASIPDPLATHLQLHAVSNPALSLSDIIRVAISLESSTTFTNNIQPSSQHQGHHGTSLLSGQVNLRPPSSSGGISKPVERPADRKSQGGRYCSYHHTRSHDSSECSVLLNRAGDKSSDRDMHSTTNRRPRP